MVCSNLHPSYLPHSSVLCAIVRLTLSLSFTSVWLLVLIHYFEAVTWPYLILLILLLGVNEDLFDAVKERGNLFSQAFDAVLIMLLIMCL